MAFSTTTDGNMSFLLGDVSQNRLNRERFFEEHNASLKDAVFMRPLDSDVITVLDESYRGRGSQNIDEALRTDAVITATQRLPIFMLPADCLPIVYFDPTNRTMAMAHLSWKSTDKGLAKTVVDTLKEQFGVNPKDLIVYLGPGIKSASYKFTDPVQKTQSHWSDHVTDHADGQTSIDLYSFNREQIEKAGVPPANIAESGIDTAASADQFSHYRSIQTGEPEGRGMSLTILN